MKGLQRDDGRLFTANDEPVSDIHLKLHGNKFIRMNS